MKECDFPTAKPERWEAAKTVDGVTTTHIWDGANMVAEANGAGITAKYYRGNGLIKQTANGTDSYYQFDGHGDTVQLTSASGTVTRDYRYDAFGSQLQEPTTDANPFRYAGEYWDAETGNIYLRARYYDPGVGRFISEDPIRDGMNWYVYCGGNPVSRWDPTGHSYDEYGNWYNDMFYYMNDGSYYGYIVNGQILGSEDLEITDVDGNQYIIKLNQIHHQISIHEDGTQYYYGPDGVYTLDGMDKIDETNTEYRKPRTVVASRTHRPGNNNKRKGSENRQPSGDRERNVGHPGGEEHSRVPKGSGGTGVRRTETLPSVNSFVAPVPSLPQVANDTAAATGTASTVLTGLLLILALVGA